MFSLDNKVHEGSANVEKTRDVGTFFTVAEHLSNSDHIGIAEFGVSSGVQTMFFSVRPIVGFCGPFEVCHEVVGLDSIDMVDLGEIGGVRNECQCDKAMYQKSGSACARTDDDTEVFLAAAARKARTYDLAWPSHRPSIFVNADAINATYTTKITDFVEVFEASDCDRSPFFRDADIHVTGCPSGNGGSAIKSPSHASTFGGFAIMAASSDAYNRRLLCP